MMAAANGPERPRIELFIALRLSGAHRCDPTAKLPMPTKNGAKKRKKVLE
jgi:hypothetical protein